MKLIELVSEVMNDEAEGNVERLRALVALHNMQKEAENVIKEIKAWKSERFNELEQDSKDYPDGYGGYTFEFRNGGKMYNFKNIEEWTKKSEELKDLEGKYKAALNLKLKGVEPIDSETGEIIPIPIITYRASSVVLKAKKS